MDEKVLAKSNLGSAKKVCLIVGCLCFLVSIFFVLNSTAFENALSTYERLEHLKPIIEGKEEPEFYFGENWYEDTYAENQQLFTERVRNCILMFLASVAITLSIVTFCYFWLAKTEMIITDKRVYGKAIFGKRVDLPLDSISAVGASWPKGLCVATAAGKITFLMLKNRDMLHNCISQLLVERQQKSSIAPVIKQEVPQSQAEELKKYKELLDMGVLSPEEFDAKKKQLLGL